MTDVNANIPQSGDILELEFLRFCQQINLYQIYYDLVIKMSTIIISYYKFGDFEIA